MTNPAIPRLASKLLADLEAVCASVSEERKRRLMAVALERLGKRRPGRPRKVR